MEFKKEFWIRFSFILVGIIIMLIALFNLYLVLKTVIEYFIANNSLPNSIDKTVIIKALYVLLFGYGVYFVGRHWSNSLKSLTNVLVMSAAFMVTVAIICYGIYDKSDDFVNSVQPSIDYMIANVVDDTLAKQLPIEEGKKISLVLSDKIDIGKIYAKNITLDQANLIAKELKFDKKTDNEKLVLAKIVVSTTYDEILKKGPEFINTPIPLSTIASEANKSGVDLNLINYFNASIFESFFQVNENAYLNVLISENTQKKQLVIGNLNYDDVTLIWKNLGIKSNISDESKLKITNILLSAMSNELDKNGLSNLDIPVASLGGQIPKEYSELINYDLLNPNVTVKQKEIERVRNDCENNKINVEQVCSVVEMTSYNNFMSNIGNLSKESNMNLPVNVTQVTKPISTLGKLNNTIKGKTSKWKEFFIISFILYALSVATYYAHFKLFKREFLPVQIPYYVSKMNLYNFVPTFILLAIIVYLFDSGMALDFVAKIIPSNNGFDIVAIISNLPFYNSMLNILDYVLILSGWFLIASFVLYMGFFIWLKIEVSKFEKHSEAPEFRP